MKEPRILTTIGVRNEDGTFSHEERIVPYLDPEERIYEAIAELERETKGPPETLLLGWRAWLSIGAKYGAVRASGPTEFEGLKVVVDDTDPDVVKALPSIPRMRAFVGVLPRSGMERIGMKPPGLITGQRGEAR